MGNRYLKDYDLQEEEQHFDQHTQGDNLLVDCKVVNLKIVFLSPQNDINIMIVVQSYFNLFNQSQYNDFFCRYLKIVNFQNKQKSITSSLLFHQRNKQFVDSLRFSRPISSSFQILSQYRSFRAFNILAIMTIGRNRIITSITPHSRSSRYLHLSIRLSRPVRSRLQSSSWQPSHWLKHSYSCLWLPSGSFWQQSVLRCFINYTQIDHALTEIGNAEECACQSDFMWKEGQCVTTCGLKVGEAATFNQNDNHCDCLSGFQYFNSPEGGACYRSCSDFANTEGYFGKTPGSCTCIIGLEWNDKTTLCENLCQGPYDTQTNSVTPTTCDCVQPAVFSSAIGKCIPICRNDPLSVGSFNFDSFDCYCKTNAHWSKESVSCECNSGHQENSDLKKCEIVSGSSFVPIAVGSPVCSGGVVFLGLLLKQKRKQMNEETGESKNSLEGRAEEDI